VESPVLLLEGAAASKENTGEQALVAQGTLRNGPRSFTVLSGSRPSRKTVASHQLWLARSPIGTQGERSIGLRCVGANGVFESLPQMGSTRIR
jgi:hypothetical protein